MPETIDLTPDWAPLIPLMCAVLANPEADYKARKDIESELLRIARAVDKLNHANRKEREERGRHAMDV